tara:strand:+ start:10338 stop:12899 length:2562 start_codon:yes stop_codon:yes gene_type:complete
MANGDGPMTPEQLEALITRMAVLNDAMADQKVTAEEVLVIQDDRLEALKEELKQNGLALESKTAQLELQKEAFKLQREDIQTRQKQLDIQFKAGDLTQRAYELQKQELDLAEKSVSAAEKELGIEKQLTAEQQKQAKADAKAAKVQELKAKFAGVIFDALAAQAKAAVDIGRSFGDMKVELQAAAGGATFLQDTFMSMNKEGTFEMQKEAVVGLNASMKNFSLLTASQRKDLAEQQVLFGRLGVTADQTGKIMQGAMTTFGMSMEEAKGVQLELAGAARDLGIPTGEMMDSFASAMPNLAKFGKGATKEFKRLQVIAKKTGLSFDTMMNAMGQFDTIDGAAEAAANLNSVLGLNVNAMDMLNMSESERIMHLRDQLKLSGKSFDNMNKLERKAAAEAMGIEVDQLGALMNSTGEKIDLDKEMVMTQGELTKTSQQLVTSQEREQKKQEAIVGSSKELANTISNMVAGFDNFIISLGIFGSVFTAVLGTVFTMGVEKARKAFVDMVSGAGEAMEEGAESAEEAGPKVKSFMTETAEGVKDLGEAATSNAKGILAFGAAFLMMGAGVAVAALGVAELVKSFSGFNATEILAIAVALGVFGATMVGLGYMLVLAAPALAGAAVPLLAFGAAMLMMGGAVALAAIGLSMATPQLLALVTGLAPYAPAMIQMGIALPLMGLGFGAMAVGVGALGLALKLISTEDLVAISEMAKGFSDFAQNITSEFTAAMSAIGDFVDAVDDIGKSDVEVFARLRQEITPLLSAPVTPGVAREMQGLSRAAIDYAKANSRLKMDADDDAFVALLKALKGAVGTVGGGGSASGGGGGGGNTIILQLNGREFARAVGAAIDSRHDLRLQG